MALLPRSHTSHAASDDVSALAPRERILSAARDLFYRQGINSVGVEAIAEAASTNKMTLYRHFKSKDDLIVAYVSEYAREGEEFWQRIEDAFPHDPKKRLEAWLGHVEEVLTNRFERGCALANASVELRDGHPARRVIESYKKRQREKLVALFSAVGFQDPSYLADEIFLIFEGARISKQYGGRGPASRVSKMLRDLLAAATRRHR